MKIFSSLMLKNFSSHLTWKLSWTPVHKRSPLFQWTWTRPNFPLQKGLPWCTAGYETWFTGATLIEIGVYAHMFIDSTYFAPLRRFIYYSLRVYSLFYFKYCLFCVCIYIYILTNLFVFSLLNLFIYFSIFLRAVG